jgi:hypothetical protein
MLVVAAVFRFQRERTRLSNDHWLIVKEKAFEVLPLHVVVDITPIPPETKLCRPPVD